MADGTVMIKVQLDLDPQVKAALFAIASALSHSPEPLLADAGQPKLLTLNEVADNLGCSKMHVYRLIRAGALKAVDTSLTASRTKLRVRSEDLARYRQTGHGTSAAVASE